MYIDSADFDSTHIYSSWYVDETNKAKKFANIYKINLVTFAEQGYCKFIPPTVPSTKTVSKLIVDS